MQHWFRTHTKYQECHISLEYINYFIICNYYIVKRFGHRDFNVATGKIFTLYDWKSQFVTSMGIEFRYSLLLLSDPLMWVFVLFFCSSIEFCLPDTTLRCWFYACESLQTGRNLSIRRCFIDHGVEKDYIERRIGNQHCRDTRQEYRILRGGKKWKTRVHPVSSSVSVLN